MTRPARWCRPRVDDIYAAPELAVLAILEAAIDVALVAVAAAYPNDDVDDVAPEQRAADVLVDTGRELHAAINRYRLALVLAQRRDRLLPF